MNVSFEKIDKALNQLKEATSRDHVSELERDGVIQRFEYTIELLWKVSKKILANHGVIAVSLKDVIRELAYVGWITNPEDFIEYLKMRNETSHSYEEHNAKMVYESSKKFAVHCDELIHLLKEKAK